MLWYRDNTELNIRDLRLYMLGKNSICQMAEKKKKSTIRINLITIVVGGYVLLSKQYGILFT